MPTNELGAAEKRYELRKRFFVEFASVASNTADIEYLSAPRFDFGIDKCNRVFHFTNFVISCPSNEKQKRKFIQI